MILKVIFVIGKKINKIQINKILYKNKNLEQYVPLFYFSIIFSSCFIFSFRF